MKLAVIVPCYNAAHVLPKTVPAMMSQEGDARWTFVDDGSTDKTADVLRGLLAGHADRTAVLALGRNRGRAAARNAGIEASGDADVLVLLDADAAPEPGFLAAHRQAYEDGASAAVARLTYAEADRSEPYGSYLNSALRGPRAYGDASAVPWRYWVTTACSVRRDAYAAAGGFDQHITYGEDLDLAGRLARAHPDGLRVAGRAQVYDHRDLAGTKRVIREFGQRNLPRMIRTNPELAGLAGLTPFTSSASRHRAFRAALRLAGPLAERSIPLLPARYVSHAVRLALASELSAAFQAGRKDYDEE